MQGEPKTEMWVIAGAAPGACVYAGVQPGTTRELFAAALADGSAGARRINFAVADALKLLTDLSSRLFLFLLNGMVLKNYYLF